MALTLDRPSPNESKSAAPRRALHHPVVAAAGAVAGLALAFLVGHDGSLGGQVVRTVAVLAVFAAGLFLVATGRASDRTAGAGALIAGWLAVVVGAGFLPHLVKAGATLVALAGVAALAAGIVLVVAGAVMVLHGRRLPARIGGAVGVVVVTLLAAWVATPAVMATNVPRPALGATPASVGLVAEDVTLTTTDGVTLAGWYVPARSGAAVVLRHGAGSTRSNVLDQAAVLARHGYGVLAVDARGHGASGGRAMDFGWYGDEDIDAATRFLAARPEVGTGRIAVVGLSMGGEEAIGASATNPLIAAVVAEGATARTAADEAWLSDEYGVRGAFQEVLEKAQDGVTDVLTSAPVPTSLHAAIAGSGATPYLLITAGRLQVEAEAAAFLAGAAPDRVTVWTVPDAGHTGGLGTAPAEWEQRVTDFLASALGVPAAAHA